ncbi:MAG TPA: uracil-DNA glycosylase [Rhodoblastus sp.]|nr:uracil-DNA glycosylase [Rhodoblastus sp.]
MAAPDAPTHDALAAALDFYRHVGADIAVGEAPRNFFAESEAARRGDGAPPPLAGKVASGGEAGSDRRQAGPSRPAALGDLPARGEVRRSFETSPRDPPRRSAPPPLPEASRPLNPALAADAAAVAASAAQRAAAARDLDELRAALDAFDGCALKTTATQLVFEDGARKTRVHLVGEAPGAEEDREGRPFVGRAGQLLDKMLASIGLDRTQVYISNVVPWRPPGNRTPSPLEVAACLPFTRRQIELVGADFLICLGAPSMQALLEIKAGILKTRGRWMTYDGGGRSVPAMAMLHPAYLLRQPLQKRLAWRDLRALRRALDGEAPDLDGPA